MEHQAALLAFLRERGVDPPTGTAGARSPRIATPLLPNSDEAPMSAPRARTGRLPRARVNPCVPGPSSKSDSDSDTSAEAEKPAPAIPAPPPPVLMTREPIPRINHVPTLDQIGQWDFSNETAFGRQQLERLKFELQQATNRGDMGTYSRIIKELPELRSRIEKLHEWETFNGTGVKRSLSVKLPRLDLNSFQKPSEVLTYVADFIQQFVLTAIPRSQTFQHLVSVSTPPTASMPHDLKKKWDDQKYNPEWTEQTINKCLMEARYGPPYRCTEALNNEFLSFKRQPREILSTMNHRFLRLVNVTGNSPNTPTVVAIYKVQLSARLIQQMDGVMENRALELPWSRLSSIMDLAVRLEVKPEAPAGVSWHVPEHATRTHNKKNISSSFDSSSSFAKGKKRQWCKKHEHHFRGHCTDCKSSKPVDPVNSAASSLAQVVCHKCKEKGHYANKCPQRGKPIASTPARQG